MARSDALKEAQSRYYEKVKEQKKEQMRKRAEEKAKEREQRKLKSLEEAKKVKEEDRERYYKNIESYNRRLIEEWLKDKHICPEFKAFLRECVLPVVDKCLPKKFLQTCRSHLTIVCGRKALESSPVIVDAPEATPEREARSETNSDPL